jgi:hypothetical protein
MPKAYSQVHDNFNVEQVGPWLHVGDSLGDPDLPELEPHPSLNPVVQVLDREKIGRQPKHITTYLDIPAVVAILPTLAKSRYMHMAMSIFYFSAQHYSMLAVGSCT